MMRRKPTIAIPLLCIGVLIAGVLACGGGGDAPEPSEEVAPPPVLEESAAPPPTSPPAESEGDTGGSIGNYDTVFPLPDNVQNFTGEGGESMVNFQTSLSLKEVIKFYRKMFAEMDMTEREILTTIEDTAFSIVFDGWPNGKALVIQGVDLGNATNVNIRFEDV